MDRKEQIFYDLYDYIVSEAELLDIWDDFVLRNEVSDKYVYTMDELEYAFDDVSVYDFAFMIHDGNFDPNDDYFIIDDALYSYESLLDYLDNDKLEGLIDYIIDNDDDFNDDRIREILNS